MPDDILQPDDVTPDDPFEAWYDEEHWGLVSAEAYAVAKFAWHAALAYAASECRREIVDGAWLGEELGWNRALRLMADRLSPKGTP